MTCRPCLDTYIHTYKQTINQYKQIVLIHKSIETYSYTFTWLQMVRPPQPTHRGGAGTLCVHVVSLCADTKTMTCRPCWDTHILTYQQTDRQTHRHTYINQYKHIVIPIDGCICVTYPPFGGGGGGEPGGPGSCIRRDFFNTPVFKVGVLWMEIVDLVSFFDWLHSPWKVHQHMQMGRNHPKPT